VNQKAHELRRILALEVVVHLLRCLAASVIAHQQIANQLFKFLAEIPLISHPMKHFTCCGRAMEAIS
jgi:hypothetical protein